MVIIGIDLCTSNSAAAVLRGRKPVIIPSLEGPSLGGKERGDLYVRIAVHLPDSLTSEEQALFEKLRKLQH